MHCPFRVSVALSVSKWVKRGASNIVRAATVTEVGILEVRYSNDHKHYQEETMRNSPSRRTGQTLSQSREHQCTTFGLPHLVPSVFNSPLGNVILLSRHPIKPSQHLWSRPATRLTPSTITKIKFTRWLAASPTGHQPAVGTAEASEMQARLIKQCLCLSALQRSSACLMLLSASYHSVPLKSVKSFPFKRTATPTSHEDVIQKVLQVHYALQPNQAISQLREWQPVDPFKVHCRELGCCWAERHLRNCLAKFLTTSSYNLLASSQTTSVTVVSKAELLELLTETYCLQGS
ncbi:hypothetical protein BU25DRAFT_422635 [Macroventuria anomochaeta]|uniref:Uncharacterized protein n=1 Tax=Macroventuria anomochaeta TaxID=301207 RepID=A0ACB6RYJ0_9PLEO|nr:uncharacterized protein BU25DRAFT_422635 [Macroventuria anomochaeta]KAF2626485.1 hypothetical protein BU25DRAFT_422635 [Macroventuria anomochaeta]